MTHPISVAIEEVARQRRLAKQIIEAHLFSSPTALTLEQLSHPLKQLGEVPTELIVQLLRELAEDLSVRGSAIELAELAGGYILRTRAAVAPFLMSGGSRRSSDRLSPSLLEVLAIIAYRQPVTRPQIEALRGVDSSYAVNGLLERGLVEVVGRADKPGRPALYATTRAFLQHFGLQDLSELLPGPTPPETAELAPPLEADGL